VLLRKSLGRGFAPLKDPLGIALVFHVKRSAKPAKHLKHYPAKTPDLDNYVKAFFDAANKILFEDDAQICQLSARKMYCEEKPHIEFMVWKLFDRDDKHKELDRPE